MKNETARTVFNTVAITVIVFIGIGTLLSFVSKKPEAERIVYRKVGDTSLTLDIYRPAHWKPSDRRPCMVWFFGGGWEVGGPPQFAGQALQLAAAGYVSITPDYRVRSRHGQKTTPFDAVSDALHAITWVRDHASELGIDPSRIAAGGGSSGGHLAVVCALLNDGKINEEFLPPPHPAGSRPDGLVLFNPLLDFDIPAVHQRTTPSQRENLKAISPLQLLDSSLPPTLILHGTADNIIPIKTSEAFVMAAEKAGVKTVKLVRYPGQRARILPPRPGFAGCLRDVDERSQRISHGTGMGA